ncbi:MAG TPA: hypothetical protein VNJ11_18145 [Bryobacteraceae bacterium]|nr:hypothetical protein [Bryobacteraceae bacterium]
MQADTEPVVQFERGILAPLQALLVVCAVAFLAEGMWVWLAFSVAGLFYLGTICARLHPLQSARDLAAGPWSNPVARLEQRLLPAPVQRELLRKACGRVGILAGSAAGLITLFGLHWSWLPAAVLAAAAAYGAGAILARLFCGGPAAGGGADPYEWRAPAPGTCGRASVEGPSGSR